MKYIVFYEINCGEYRLDMEIHCNTLEKVNERTLKINGALIELEEDSIITSIKKIVIE